MRNDLRLGQRLRDKVTGFVGIADARTEFLSGCVRFALIARVDDSTPSQCPEPVWFDLERLEFLDEGLADLDRRPSGGDRRDHPSRTGSAA